MLSSVTCQLGVFAAERGDVVGLRRWFVITFLMGAFFIGGQIYEYTELVKEGLTLSSSGYGSVFYLPTGFHGLHVTGGLIAFLFILGRTYAARRFTHDQATSAIVVSYYWHFVDVVWIGLFATIYLIIVTGERSDLTVGRAGGTRWRQSWSSGWGCSWWVRSTRPWATPRRQGPAPRPRPPSRSRRVASST